MDGYYSFDAGTIFPVESNVVDPSPILQLSDPVLYQICVFFTQLLNTNLQPRFSQEALACGVTHANVDNWVDGVAVAQTIDFPIRENLAAATDFKFPLLSIFTEQEEYHQMTLTNVSTKRDFVLHWVFPPLISKQYNHLYHFLQLASKTILGYGQQGFDPKVNPQGPSAWQTAGLSFGTFQGAKYTHLDGIVAKKGIAGTHGKFPALEMRFSFWERCQLPVPQNFETFTDVYLQENLVDGYNPANPIDNFIDGYIAPDITMTSVVPSSGTIQGGTLLFIYGTGFLANKLQDASQLTICGSPAQTVQMRQPNVMMAITNPGVAGTAGQVGDIIFTDLQGNQYTLPNSYSFTSP
jgi:hypothetical protein